MAALRRFFRIGNITPSTTKPRPRSPSSISTRKQSQYRWANSRTMDDSDDDYSFLSRRQSIPSTTLIAFYEGTGRDMNNRTLAETMALGARAMEYEHQYIQTLFPLPEKSGIVDHAPIIDKEVFDAFHARPELRNNLRESFKKMLWFYGLHLTTLNGKAKVDTDPNSEFHPSSKNWNRKYDHNHLRMTRIIRCLRVLGLEEEALAFYKEISHESRVTSKTLKFWERAAYRQLNIAPNISEQDADDEDETIGPDWLFEEEKQRKVALAGGDSTTA